MNDPQRTGSGPVEKRADRRNQDRDPLRGFRCDDELWQAALVAAAFRRESVSMVIRRSLRRYVAAHAKAIAELEARGESPDRRHR